VFHNGKARLLEWKPYVVVWNLVAAFARSWKSGGGIGGVNIWHQCGLRECILWLLVPDSWTWMLHVQDVSMPVFALLWYWQRRFGGTDR